MIKLLDDLLVFTANLSIYLTYIEVRKNKSNLLIFITFFISFITACGALYIELN